MEKQIDATWSDLAQPDANFKISVRLTVNGSNNLVMIVWSAFPYYKFNISTNTVHQVWLHGGRKVLTV